MRKKENVNQLLNSCFFLIMIDWYIQMLYNTLCDKKFEVKMNLGNIFNKSV